MKKLLLSLFLFAFSFAAFSQTCQDAAVELYATAQNGPPKIILNWIPNSTTTSYSVYRKLKTGLTWGAVQATLSGTTNSYTDASVTAGTNYEYRLVRTGSGYSGYGYINSGIEIPVTE